MWCHIYFKIVVDKDVKSGYNYIMDKQKRLTVEIDEDLHRQAKSKAYDEGKTLKDKMVELLKKWLRG